MSIVTDHTFHIGEQHLRQGKPCQDYALSGHFTGSELYSNLEARAYAIVSDGCSSGGMTDIGARLMTLATRQSLREQNLYEMMDNTSFRAGRDTYLRQWQQAMSLEQNDLLATTLAVATDGNYLVANIAGDGVLVTKTVCGDMIVRKYEWQKNTPFYPAYNLARETQQGFIDAHQKGDALTIETWKFLAGSYEHIDTTIVGVYEAAREIILHESIPNWPHWIDHYDLAAVFSDGVFQVENIDWKDVVQELLAFKSTKGQFVARRMNKFLSDAKQNGRGTFDDIAYAVITTT